MKFIMVFKYVVHFGGRLPTSVFRQLHIEMFSFCIALCKSHTIKQEFNCLGKERVQKRNAHG